MKIVGKNSSGWISLAAIQGRFERLTVKAPGFAGGYDYF